MSNAKRERSPKSKRTSAPSAAGAWADPAKRRRILAWGCVGLACASALAIVLALSMRKPILAFYDLPETVRAAIASMAGDEAFGGGRFALRDLDPAAPLAEQLKKGPRPALVFAWQGEAARGLAGEASPPLESVRRLLPSGIRAAGTDGGKAFALPLLLDHFEAAYDRRALGRAGKGKPETLRELEAAARAIKKPTLWPMICAGGNDEDLLMLAGALTESLGGDGAWTKVTEAMARGEAFPLLVKTTPLGASLARLAEWRAAGLLHPEWFRMKDADVAALMENGNAGIVFMTLSLHRRIPLETIDNYEGIPMPPAAKGGPRSFTAPVLEGALLGKGRPDRRAEAFLYALVGDEGQKRLTRATGLAPVASTAEAQDRQASDVRFWIAASARPLPEMSRASYPSPAKRKAFAGELRAYVESGGAGY